MIEVVQTAKALLSEDPPIIKSGCMTFHVSISCVFFLLERAENAETCGDTTHPPSTIFRAGASTLQNMFVCFQVCENTLCVFTSRSSRDLGDTQVLQLKNEDHAHMLPNCRRGKIQIKYQDRRRVNEHCRYDVWYLQLKTLVATR